MLAMLSYPKGIDSRIQAINKTKELLSVMIVYRNVFHNGSMAYTRNKFMKVLSTEFLWHV